ncbi:hypothetical protein GN956_G24568 [Arapaima gigas]
MPVSRAARSCIAPTGWFPGSGKREGPDRKRTRRRGGEGSVTWRDLELTLLLIWSEQRFGRLHGKWERTSS